MNVFKLTVTRQPLGGPEYYNPLRDEMPVHQAEMDHMLYQDGYLTLTKVDTSSHL